MIFVLAWSFLSALPQPYTSVDPPLKVDGGAEPSLKLTKASNHASIASASGWFVLDEADANASMSVYAGVEMTHVSIACQQKTSRCFFAHAVAGARDEFKTLKRLQPYLKTLHVVRWDDDKIVAERPFDCERSLWTLDFKAQRVTVKGRRDPKGRSEMDACPKEMKVDAHLGAFEEALRVFRARDPKNMEFKASNVPSGAPSPIEIVEGENPRAGAWKEPKDEGIGASGWVIVDEGNAGVLAYEKSTLKKVSIQCQKKECTIAEAKIFKAADNPARQLVGSELHFAKVLEWDAAHAVIEQPTACARLRWTVNFRDERTTLIAIREPGVVAIAACPQDLKLSAHLGTFKDAVAAFRDAK